MQHSVSQTEYAAQSIKTSQHTIQTTNAETGHFCSGMITSRKQSVGNSRKKRRVTEPRSVKSVCVCGLRSSAAFIIYTLSVCLEASGCTDLSSGVLQNISIFTLQLMSSALIYLQFKESALTYGVPICSDVVFSYSRFFFILQVCK